MPRDTFLRIVKLLNASTLDGGSKTLIGQMYQKHCVGRIPWYCHHTLMIRLSIQASESSRTMSHKVLLQGVLEFGGVRPRKDKEFGSNGFPPHGESTLF